MDDLASDLRAYLENRVVQAHRTGTIAELRKWTRRNRVTAVSLGAVALLLVVGLVVSLILLREVRDERDAKQTAIGRIEQESLQKDEALEAKNAALLAKNAALAERQRALSEKESALDRAESTRLCAQSSALLSTDPSQSLLMAIEAYRLRPGERSRSSLAAALDHLREEATLIGHRFEVTGVSFHPDGKHVASGARDGTVRIWDVENVQEERRLLGHRGGINGAAYSPNGSLLASWAWDGELRLWESKSGKLVHLFEHEDVVLYAEFSRDGKSLLSACRDGVVRIWRFSKIFGQRPPIELKGLAPRDLRHASRSPDGLLAAGASRDGTTLIWNTVSGKAIHVLRFHKAPVVHTSFDARGMKIVTASEDGTAALWNSTTGERLSVLRGHERPLTSALFSPNGNRVLTASLDTTVRVWNAESGQLRTVLQGHGGPILDAEFSPDGRTIVTASEDRSCRLWSTATGTQIDSFLGHQSEVGSVSFSGDGTRVVSGSRDNTARVWRVVDAKGDLDQRSPRVTQDRHLSPDGTTGVELGGGTARVVDVRTGDLVFELKGHASQITATSFSRSGRRVATASTDGTARVWSVSDGREISTLRGHRDEVAAIALSADGSRVVTGSNDSEGAIWDATTGVRLRQLRGHGGFVTAVAISADRVASASMDGSLRLWRLDDSESSRALTLPKAWLHGAHFSDDGKKLLVASRMNQLFVIDVTTETLETTLVGHDSDLRHALFHADQSLVLTIHDDASAYAWELPSGELNLSLRSRGVRFGRATFTGDGKALETVRLDGSRTTWSLEPFEEAVASRPRIPDTYDRVRIDVGTKAERQQRTVERGAWFLRNTLRVADRVWADDPSNRRACFLTSQEALLNVRSLWSLRQNFEPSHLPLVHRALKIAERAVNLPEADPRAVKAVSSIRELAQPALLTCASVDSAFEAAARERIVTNEAQWRLARKVPETLRWTQVDFDDHEWETQSSHSISSGKTQESYPARRHVFSVPEPKDWSKVILEVSASDGFVAWLNGREITRANAG
ncbi:MAG: hypothetical protein AAF517_18695, partial [Planctomycetota bacterium]